MRNIFLNQTGSDQCPDHPDSLSWKKGQVNLNKVSCRDRDRLTRQLLQLAQKIILNYNDDKIFSPDISQALSASLSVCHSPPV